jgi:hypothetical protein
VPGVKGEDDWHRVPTATSAKEVQSKPHGKHTFAGSRLAEHHEPPGRYPSKNLYNMG